MDVISQLDHLHDQASRKASILEQAAITAESDYKTGQGSKQAAIDAESEWEAAASQEALAYIAWQAACKARKQQQEG